MGVMTTNKEQNSHIIDRRKYHKHRTINMDENEALPSSENKLK